MNLKTKIISGFLLLSFAGLLYAHLHFCYNTYYIPGSSFQKATKNPPLDAIIVPGIPCDGGKWGFVMKWRMHWAVYLYKMGIAKNLIFSGSAVYTAYTESLIMALYAEKMGIPKEHIFVENKAEHTTENLYYGYQLAKSKGFNRIGFATDPFQSLKIEPYITKFKLDVCLLPMVVSTVENMPMQEYSVESYKAYQLNFVSINQRETPEEQAFYSKGGRVLPLITKP